MINTLKTRPRETMQPFPTIKSKNFYEPVNLAMYKTDKYGKPRKAYRNYSEKFVPTEIECRLIIEAAARWVGSIRIIDDKDIVLGVTKRTNYYKDYAKKYRKEHTPETQKHKREIKTYEQELIEHAKNNFIIKEKGFVTK